MTLIKIKFILLTEHLLNVVIKALLLLLGEENNYLKKLPLYRAILISQG